MERLANTIARNLGYTVEMPRNGIAYLRGNGRTLVFRHFVMRGTLTSTISDGGRIVLRNPQGATAAKELKALGY